MAVTVTLFLLKTLNCFPWYLAIVLPGYCFLQLFFRSILVFSLLCCMPARLHIPSSSFSSYSGIPECLFYIPSNWQCQHNMTKSLLYFLSSWWWEQRKLQVLYIQKCRDQNMQVCWLDPRVNKLPHAECGDVEIGLARRHLQTCPEGTFRYNNVHDALASTTFLVGRKHWTTSRYNGFQFFTTSRSTMHWTNCSTAAIWWYDFSIIFRYKGKI